MDIDRLGDILLTGPAGKYAAAGQTVNMPRHATRRSLGDRKCEKESDEDEEDHCERLCSETSNTFGNDLWVVPLNSVFARMLLLI